MHGMIGVIQPTNLKQLEKFGNTLKNVDVEILKNKSLKKIDKRRDFRILVHIKAMGSFLKKSGCIKYKFLHWTQDLRNRFLNGAWNFKPNYLLKKLKKSDMHFKLMEKKIHILNTTILIRKRKKVSSEKFNGSIDDIQFMNFPMMFDTECRGSSNKSSLFDIAMKEDV